jgi:hypothetical protein
MVGGEHTLSHISLRHWQRFPREVRISDSDLIDRLRSMAQQLPHEANEVRALVEAEGLDKNIIDRLATRLIERAKDCQRKLEEGEQ